MFQGNTFEVCEGQSIRLSVTDDGSIYSWSNDTTDFSINVSPLQTTVYAVTVTDISGCSATARRTVSADACTGIRTYSAAASQLLVYPNPATDGFTIKSSAPVSGMIINLLGQPVQAFTLVAEQAFAQRFNGLTAGIYFIKTENASIKLIVK